MAARPGGPIAAHALRGCARAMRRAFRAEPGVSNFARNRVPARFTRGRACLSRGPGAGDFSRDRVPGGSRPAQASGFPSGAFPGCPPGALRGRPWRAGCLRPFERAREIACGPALPGLFRTILRVRPARCAPARAFMAGGALSGSGGGPGHGAPGRRPCGAAGGEGARRRFFCDARFAPWDRDAGASGRKARAGVQSARRPGAVFLDLACAGPYQTTS